MASAQHQDEQLIPNETRGDVEKNSLLENNTVFLFGIAMSKATYHYLTLLFCFVGLQLSYLTWGIVQERVMTKEYTPGKFKSSAFLVFSNRFLALFISLGIVMYRRLASGVATKDAPFLQYAPSSISNSLSSWAQYEALKYVSFPTQVLSKSCKILPVMLVGILLNKVLPSSYVS